MEYIELDIILHQSEKYADILFAKLHEIQFESCSQDEHGIKAYIPARLFDQEAVDNVLSEFLLLTNLTFKISGIIEKNWNSEWEQNYSPVFINDRCVIRAHFHDSFDDMEHEIIITPKMSFGTGHHETTSLMINEMFQLEFQEKSVLDIGTGTGVLSILASKLGAKYLLGIDLDEWAFKNSLENAVLNNVSNINFIHGDVSSIKQSEADIVLANINRNVILNDIKNYISIMRKNARILLSGFLQEDIPVVLEKTSQFGLELITQKNKNKWQMLHLKKN
tara:strand:- start:14675 stop:15508 length:834 start_codon:yes stop_codon:yes gene_type:complete